MAIFEVYLPEHAAMGSDEPTKAVSTNDHLDIEAVRLLRDGNSFWALVFPFVWLVWNRLWFALGIYVLFAFWMVGLGYSQWAPLISALSFLPGVYLFLEGRNLIAARWERSGFRLVEVIEADTRDAAELKWISRHLSDRHPGSGSMGIGTGAAPGLVSALSQKGAPTHRSLYELPDFGLFSEDR